MKRISIPAYAAALLLAVPGDPPPATPEEAIAFARPLVEPARKAKPGEAKEIADGLRKAIDALKAQSKAGLKDQKFQVLWNESISLGHFLGLKPLPDYAPEEVRMTSHPVKFAFPFGRGWNFLPLRPGKDDQLWGEISRTLPNGRVTCRIRFWIYRWDTVYSGTGGENAKGLAEGNFEADRENMTKVTSRSPRVVTTRMSRGFPKASFYEVAGVDDKLGPARRRNYYVKGASTTYNFEVIEMRKTEEADDAFTAWQCQGPDPELAYLIESFGEYEVPKKK